MQPSARRRRLITKKNVKFILLSACISLGQLYAQTGRDYHLDKEFPVSLGGKLTLRSSDANVVITGSNRTTAHVKIDRVVTVRGWVVTSHDDFSVDIVETNGNLAIRERATGTVGMLVGSYSETYSIVLEIPLGMSLDLVGDDGHYQIKRVHGAIELDVDDADVELAGCQGTYFSFRLDDGDLIMDQGAGQLFVDGDDADFRIREARFSSMDVRLDDGDFEVSTALADNGHYTINLQDGRVALTITGGGGRIAVSHDDADVSAQGSFQTLQESEEHTELKTGTGTADVRIRADDARILLARG